MIEWIHGVAGITPEWLTNALSRAGYETEVTDVAAKAIGTGQMSQSIRVTPRYAGRTDAPASMVIKVPGLSDAARAGGAAGAYPSEVRFYSALADSVAIAVPGCHLAVVSDDGADFVLILDDMAPAVQGDQIAGCDRNAAAAAVTALAGLAGPRWCDPTLTEVEGLTRPSTDVAGFWAAVFAEATDTFVGRYGDRLSADEIDVLAGAALRMERWMLARPERFGLIHGDFRLDNLLFDPIDPGAVVTVDWQTVNIGLPARDLAYFCGNSLLTETRRSIERELVGTYHAALEAFGVTDYPEAACWDDYRFGHLQGPLITVLGAAYADPTDRGDEMFLAMTTRCCQAIVDLDTFALIDRDESNDFEPVA